MKQIKEQLINFDTAKLAKEKGFNIYCNYKYCGINGERLTFHPNIEVKCNNEVIQIKSTACTAPTQSLLQKWLREEHRVDIQIIRNKPMYHEYRVEIYKINDETNYQYLQINENNSNYCKWFNTYEDALEEALQEALKLI